MAMAGVHVKDVDDNNDNVEAGWKDSSRGKTVQINFPKKTFLEGGIHAEDMRLPMLYTYRGGCFKRGESWTVQEYSVQSSAKQN